MGSDALWVDSVRIELNCRTPSRCYRIALCRKNPHQNCGQDHGDGPQPERHVWGLQDTPGSWPKKVATWPHSHFPLITENTLLFSTLCCHKYINIPREKGMVLVSATFSVLLRMGTSSPMLAGPASCWDHTGTGLFLEPKEQVTGKALEASRTKVQLSLTSRGSAPKGAPVRSHFIPSPWTALSLPPHRRTAPNPFHGS